MLRVVVVTENCAIPHASPHLLTQHLPNSPIYGIIFLFKYGTETSAALNNPGETQNQQQDQPPDGTYDHAAADHIFFASQVIPNACGTQALLSVLLNKDSATSSSQPSSTTGNPTSNQSDPAIDIGDPLRDFLTFTSSFPPLLRGETLTNSPLIRTVHNSFSRSSIFASDPNLQPPPSPGDDELYHFIAYTPISGTLYELDGLRPAPISHGPCTFSSFPRDVVAVLRRRIERYPATEIRFNLMALVRDRRAVCREVGDWEGVEREERKRREWGWENALRGHNFLGFAGEVLKRVVEGKVAGEGGGEEAYREWVEGAVKETERRVRVRREKKGGADGGGGMDVD